MTSARRTARLLVVATGLAGLLAACSQRREGPDTSTIPGGVAGTPPAMLLGRFVDDYRGRPDISADRWAQGANTVYLPVEWNADGQYVIARNAADNETAPGAWTRIDWMPLDDMAPYIWAYCLSAYDAPTRDSAERTRVANRATPRTGCNGFPFSRVQPRGIQ